MEDLTPLADLDHAGIAAVLREEALLGGIDEHECEDPALWVLWDEVGRYMLGECHVLAAHLHRERGFEVVVLEARGGQACLDWVMRHVAVTPLPAARVAAELVSTDGLELPVIDAIGDGTLGERLRLYDGFDEYRVVHADGRGAAWFERFRNGRDAVLGYDPAAAMPGLALALGERFDLASAIFGILERMEAPTRSRIPALADLEAALAEASAPPSP